MGAILVTMNKREDSGRIADIIKRSGTGDEVFVCDTGSEVLRKIEDMDVSLLVCTRRLKDMGYEELFNYLPSGVSMLLLTKNTETELFSSNIIVLQIPFRTADLINSISMLLPFVPAGRKKKPAPRPESEKLLIEKAKRLLMERNSMTEPEAYRYLQKNSMDMGRSMTETADMILAMN
ncbi:MAG: ANTAR domain-containing protein [Lachnospiraceae bacterium]|nr:ANTAR domain-containing protein [Lachnospiraceae bacterium]